MGIEFKSVGDINTGVYLHGTPIAYIRISSVYGPIIDYDDDVTLDVHEQESILAKMRELQSEVKK